MPGDDDTFDETTLFEIGCKVYFLSQWRNKEGFAKNKAEYIRLRNEFIEKLRLEYPQMADAEVFNFFNEDSHTKSFFV